MLTIRSLYKYLRREHARALLRHGTVRIGTLRSYRVAELGPAAGDSSEGTSRTRHMYDEPTDVSKAENRSWVTDRVFKIQPGVTDVVLQNVGLEVREESPDYFLYCMTHTFNIEAMRAFEADICVEIVNPQKFLDTLTGFLEDAGITKGAVLSPCDYSGRSRSQNDPRTHSALLKNSDYSYQEEVRLIMAPKRSTTIEPFIINIPELRRFCRIRRGR